MSSTELVSTTDAPIEYTQWYKDLIEDCNGIITEAVFISRWELVKGYWNVGKRINEDENYIKHAKGNEVFLQDLAGKLNLSGRTLYYAIQVHEQYPDLEMLPEGKNISWTKLITKYLPQRNSQAEPDGGCEHEWVEFKEVRCEHCNKKYEGKPYRLVLHTVR